MHECLLSSDVSTRHKEKADTRPHSDICLSLHFPIHSFSKTEIELLCFHSPLFSQTGIPSVFLLILLSNTNLLVFTLTCLRVMTPFCSLNTECLLSNYIIYSCCAVVTSWYSTRLKCFPISTLACYIILYQKPP